MSKPNIVLMMTDNVGWGEIGTYGGGILRGAETPRIDSLATDGMKLLNYNVEPQCTPSRSATMTGRFAIRSGTTHIESVPRFALLVRPDVAARRSLAVEALAGTPAGGEIRVFLDYLRDWRPRIR